MESDSHRRLGDSANRGSPGDDSKSLWSTVGRIWCAGVVRHAVKRRMSLDEPAVRLRLQLIE